MDSLNLDAELLRFQTENARLICLASDLESTAEYLKCELDNAHAEIVSLQARLNN